MRRLSLTAISLTLALAACSGGGHRPTAAATPAAPKASSAATPTTITRQRTRLSARIVLPSLTMAGGTSAAGRVIVKNDTGRPLHADGCLRLFGIALRNQRAEQNPGERACLQRFTVPVGTSSFPITVNTSYSGCYGGPPAGDLQTCLSGSRIPPLPPGGYHVVLVGPGAKLVPTPVPPIMHVTTAAPVTP